MNLVQKNHIKINQKGLYSNDLLIYKNESDDFLKQLYKDLQLDYPKFHKMDNLSKIGFIGVEFLKTIQQNINITETDQICLIFSNSISSAQTDQLFFESYAKENSPSPSLFVYTLPNIVIGEITIRNKWYGESIFLIEEQFKYEKMYSIAKNYIELKKANICILANLEFSKNTFESIFYVLEKK